MATQSHAKPTPLLLTRPEAQGAGFAAAVLARFGQRVHLVHTPLLAPRFLVPTLPVGPFDALIITSQTGVTAYQRLSDVAANLPSRVFCVGENTASAARLAGLDPVIAAPDSARLIDHILAHPPQGRLLHLRGRDARGEVAETLVSAGIDTEIAITYMQDAVALTAEAAGILCQPDPVILPLFSPRTARLFVAEMARLGGISPLFIIAMSDQIALEAAPGAAQIAVASAPDAAAMLDSLATVLTLLQRA